MNTAYVFPGQGSQAIGMAQALATAFPVAREVLQEVDEALGQKLSQLMAEGPEDALTLTENAQPAIMAASLAAFRVMQKEMGITLPGSAMLVAGHSLGEYSALTAAGALSVTDAARLLRVRGQAMQAAVKPGAGLMAAIIGPELVAVREIVQEAATQLPGEVVEIANHNAQNQIVISGSVAGVERAMQLAKESGAKRALALAVSAPFHCSLMKPAAEKMREALAAAKIAAPLVPVVANVTAQAVSDPNQIRHLLVEQVTGMVRWVDSILYMQQQGISTLVEIGHGQVLSGLVKRIAPDIKVQNIGAPEDLDALAKAA
jgi:[acyl-carrier-protein] S-malonyltransferase